MYGTPTLKLMSGRLDSQCRSFGEAGPDQARKIPGVAGGHNHDDDLSQQICLLIGEV